jgi:hypothetical protein
VSRVWYLPQGANLLSQASSAGASAQRLFRAAPDKAIVPIAALASSYGFGVGVVATLGGMIG